MDPNQTSQTQQPLNPTTPTVNSSNSKLIPIILGVAAAIVIAIGAYVLGTKQSQPVVQNNVETTPMPTPTPDPTANWKIYKNDKLGFELKYPELYKIIEETDISATIAKDPLGTKGIRLVNNNSEEFIDINSLKSCKIIYEEIKKNPSVLRESCLDQGKNFGQSEDIANLKLDRIDAKSFFITSTGQGGTDRIIQTSNSPFVQMSFWLWNSNAPEKTRELILSTFQFSN